MFEREIRTLDYVPRWVIVRSHHRQTVASHSYFVAVYAMQIADVIGWSGDRGALLKYALQHDWAEVFTGDIPHPSKAYGMDRDRWKRFEEAQLVHLFGREGLLRPEKDIKSIVTVADLFESLLFLTGEVALGNRQVDSMRVMIMEQLRGVIDLMPGTPESKEELKKHIDKAVADELGGQTGHLNVNSAFLVESRVGSDHVP